MATGLLRTSRRVTGTAAIFAAASALPLCAQTPVDAEPRLRNAAAVGRIVERGSTAARNGGYGGVAVVRVFVSSQGVADTVRLIRSTGSPALDHAARNAGRAARFEPARRGGRSIDAWTELPFLFPTTVPGTGDDLPRSGLALVNRVEMHELAAASYPAELERQRYGASVGVLASIGPAGNVTDVELIEKSCFKPADEAAAALARSFRFEPDSGSRRRVLAAVLITEEEILVHLAGDSVLYPGPHADSEAVPMRNKPQLRNEAEIRQELFRNYPPGLRQMGRRGEVRLHVKVDEDGRVVFRRVVESSGECAFDRAALEVARKLRFSPATDGDGNRLPAWVEVPVWFR